MKSSSPELVNALGDIKKNITAAKTLNDSFDKQDHFFQFLKLAPERRLVFICLLLMLSCISLSKNTENAEYNPLKVENDFLSPLGLLSAVLTLLTVELGIYRKWAVDSQTHQVFFNLLKNFEHSEKNNKFSEGISKELELQNPDTWNNWQFSHCHDLTKKGLAFFKVRKALIKEEIKELNEALVSGDPIAIANL